MTNNHDMKLLSDELHDLAGGVGPASPAARDRARRGIARNQRNRRAAVSATGAVVVVVMAAAVFVAVDRESSDSRRPIGTTAASEPSTTGAPDTTAPITAAPGSPILSTVPPLTDLRAATTLYAKNFPWGTNPDEVAFQVPGGEGASGGPVAFTADAAGNIVMLDHSSARIVRFKDGSASADPVALASPAVTAAAFDDQGRVIVATVTDLAVFGPDGRAEGSWPGRSKVGDTIRQLEVADGRAYSLFNNDRVLLLRDDGTGYLPVRGAAHQGDAFDVQVIPPDSARHMVRIVATATGQEYRVTTTASIDNVSAVRLLPDGTLAFVLRFLHFDSLGNDKTLAPDELETFVIGRIDPAGHARYTTVTAASGYLVNGPGFVINSDGLAVMGSTIAGGVTVSYYRF